MTEVTDIVIPYRAREYQEGLFEADGKGIKRFFLVLHRRGGKDISSLAFTVKKAIQRKGIYYYVFPTSVMARNILWDNANMMKLIPRELIKRKNQVEMMIELINGSVIKLMGSDNYDRMRGTDPCGIVMSEYAFQHPLAWETLRPILANNGGWALFNTTPNGYNHAKQMFDYASERDDWYTAKLDVSQTNGIALTYRDMNPDAKWDVCLKYQDKILQDERENMDGDMFQQEYYVSFEGNKTGSYWGEQITWLRGNHRITQVPYDPTLPVSTYWDIASGAKDSSDKVAIWFGQKKGNHIYVIDYLENNTKGFDWYMKEVEDRGYTFDAHWLPHDFGNGELMIGKSRMQEAVERGWKGLKILPRPRNKVEVIDLARRTLKRCYFDSDKCKTGLMCLEAYHRDYDQLNKVFKATPKHDWSSHGCLIKGSIVECVGGGKPIEKVRVGDIVDISGVKGFVSHSGYIKTCETLKIELTTGQEIECSPEHKFFTTRGVVRADELSYNDCVHTNTHPIWDLKSLGARIREKVISLTKGISSGYGQRKTSSSLREGENRECFIGCYGKKGTENSQENLRLSPLTATDSISLGITGKKEVAAQGETSQVSTSIKRLTGLGSIKDLTTVIMGTCINAYSLIAMFGRSIMGRFLKGFTSITKTETSLITKLETLKSYLHQSTRDYTLRQILGSVVKGIENSLFGRKKKLNYGIGVQKAVNGTENTQGLSGIKSIKKGSLQAVYDITVEGHHCYIANGILTSNSDAFIYLAMASGEERIEVEEAPIDLLFEDEELENDFPYSPFPIR